MERMTVDVISFTCKKVPVLEKEEKEYKTRYLLLM